MTIKPEVLAAIKSRDNGFLNDADWQTIRAELLAMDAEVERLRKIEEERWSVVATRNAAVMRAEKAEALLAGFQVVENADVPNGEIWIYDKSKITNREPRT
jgi:hypothetical protein